MLLNRLRPEIDGLRFIAIFSVLLFHMLGELSFRSGRVIPVEPGFHWLERLLANGDRGVELFFVISGMILALPFARQFLVGSKPVSLRKYYMRRVTRLEPPYIASVIVAVFLVAVYQHGFTTGSWPHILASLFYQHSLVFGRISTVNPVTWSLEVEIQFYLLAPLVMQFFRIRGTGPRRAALVASILCLGLAQIPFRGWPRVEFSILFFLQYFLTGLLVADLFVLDLKNIRSSWLWDMAAVVSLGLICWLPRNVFWPHVMMPAALGTLCIAAMRSHALRRTLSNQWIAVIGGMCYSIYLLHFLFIAVLFKVTRHAIVPSAPFFLNYAIQLALVAVPVIAICAVFFLLVERPCMDPDWPSKLWHKITGRRGEEAAAFDAAGISE